MCETSCFYFGREVVLIWNGGYGTQRFSFVESCPRLERRVWYSEFSFVERLSSFGTEGMVLRGFPL